MNYIKVKSIEHLKELLDKNEYNYVCRSGAFQRSYDIILTKSGLRILYLSDGEIDYFTWDEFIKCYVFDELKNGRLYCETNKNYE